MISRFSCPPGTNSASIAAPPSWADRICVLEHGRVVELGTHAELMALDGVYRRMFEVQARAYQTERAGGVPKV